VDSGVQNDKEQAEQKLCFRPMLLFSGVFCTGLYGLFEIARMPVNYSVGWEQGSTFIAFCSGSLVSAVLIVLFFRKHFLSKTGVKNLSYLMLTLAVLNAVLLTLAFFFEELSVTLGLLSALIASCIVPLGVVLWALAYKRLNYRSIAFNSSFAFLAFAVMSYAIMQLSSRTTLLICAALLLIGSASILLFLKGICSDIQTMLRGGKIAERAENANVDDTDDDTSPLQFIFSVPLVGLAVYSFTIGITFNLENQPTFTNTIVICVIVAIFVLLLSVLANRFLPIPEHRSVFRVFGFYLPSLAFVAFIIKMIPIAYISDTVYLEFILFYFHLIILSAWIYLVSSLRIKSSTLILLCGLSQVVISASILFGFLFGLMGYPLNQIFLGVFTACFLLFSVVTAGRNLILSSRKTETADELMGKTLGGEERCLAISEEYSLSPRETEVLKELAYGHSSSYIAKVLYISTNTARTHMKNIYRKLDINSREDLIELIRSK
jgi:DNA-binding CsgD family transcriptional regulator